MTDQAHEEQIALERSHSTVFYIYNDALPEVSDVASCCERTNHKDKEDLKKITINNGFIKEDIEESYNFKLTDTVSHFTEVLDFT